ncbi:imidazolonepropionase-like domain-containing protein [Streptomyces sp. H27-D2]|uniref:imidazolonepropionase-like domain-containing protein n=1 Tax=Streptomyces sp. H27-D2 TaxID=3046304 RepID=UPI002DBFD518|nr:hypothetical protein [Streptomyces sp. H27-D2]MEC4017033.1 hypothetical protein [Streptomyces sp. H27-D2]
MFTIHAAPHLRLTLDPVGQDDPAEGAVAVSGDRIAAVGPLAELLASHPGARVRQWRGTLGPGLVHDAPVPPADSPRERIHALLRLGATAVTAAHVADDPELRAAAARNGIVVLDRPRPPALVTAGRADLAVFSDEGDCIATVLAGRLVHRRA